MKILFVKLGAIGDIVHTLPALAAVRNAFPAAEISWVTETRSAEILRGNPLIDQLIEIDTRSIRRRQPVDELIRDLKVQARGLRRNKYDIALDFQGLLKSAVIAKLSGAKRRAGFDRRSLREPSSRFLLTETVDVPKEINVIQKNLALVAGVFGIMVPGNDLAFPISLDEKHVIEATAISESIGGRFAILNPGGGWVTKLWPAERFGELAEMLWSRLGIASVVSTGPKEEHLAERVRSKVRDAKVVFAEPSLKGFYELSKKAEVYIGGDTGPTHLAVAAGTPVVGIFGPTEWWRNGSPFPDDICVERNDIGCRVDCHRRRCSNWICMEITTETVFNAVKKRLESQTDQKRGHVVNS